MAGGYSHKPDGADGLGAVIKKLQSQVDALRSGAGIRSAVLKGVKLVFQNENGEEIGRFGTYDVNTFDNEEFIGADTAHGAQFLDPITGQFLFSAHSKKSTGATVVQAGDAGNWSALDLFRVFSADVGINGDDVDITSSNELSMGADGTVNIFSNAFDLRIPWSSTGSAANMYLDSGTNRIFRSTSARKYKTDIAPADVDVAEVLALVGRTWVDKGKIDNPEQPEHVRRDIGFIAEELDEHPSLRQFIQYDADGEPDSIEYDRLSVALLAVLQDQDVRLRSLEERLDALEG